MHMRARGRLHACLRALCNVWLLDRCDELCGSELSPCPDAMAIGLAKGGTALAWRSMAGQKIQKEQVVGWEQGMRLMPLPRRQMSKHGNSSGGYVGRVDERVE